MGEVMKKWLKIIGLAWLLTAGPACPAAPPAYLPATVFSALAGEDSLQVVNAALQKIEAEWQDAYVPMLIEILRYTPDPNLRRAIFVVLEKHTGQAFHGDTRLAYDWLWAQTLPEYPEYPQFKAQLYRQIDQRFAEYFPGDAKKTIRLDEIVWGGVRRDGIPPLDHPKMIKAAEATYLKDDNIVFGVEINGDARAYPKRILAWHEMVKDSIGGRQLNGVYCTLCGAMIVYDTDLDGVHYELGTSGFLYRSNKLMYDHATHSMWSTLTGTPVVGELVGKGIVLPQLYVVTTTWAEWKRRHPATSVLSLDTGHQRNYDEGVAYHDYFATDRLMFEVPKRDARLANKAEVLALKNGSEQLAISSAFLKQNPLFQIKLGNVRLLVLTDASGANRVYQLGLEAGGGPEFVSWDSNKNRVTDKAGRVWQVSEAQLQRESGKNEAGQSIKRYPAHRAFWFGWVAAYPETRLIK
jgi:hypothetical protein